MSRLAAENARNPMPRTQNEARAPARLTRNPLLMLMPTIKTRPTHVWGVCRGMSPRATLTTNAACSESIRPARQTAHVAAPPTKASRRETNSDFQEKVFKIEAEVGRSRKAKAQWPTRLYTAGCRFRQTKTGLIAVFSGRLFKPGL